MNILVLGGSGFIGSHVVDELLKNGHKVRVFDRSPEKFRGDNSRVDYRFGSFDDYSLLAEALSGIDVVCHLISTTVPSTSNLDPVADIQGNLISTVKLLSLMEKMGVRKIVYLSSGGTVYGVPDLSPIPESHALKPICSYGIVKVAIENYIYMAHQSAGLDYVILRASNPYGERQGHDGVQGVVGTFLWKVANDLSIEVWGDGSVVRDFIFVSDLAELIHKCIASEQIGCFNAGSGIGTSIADILTSIKTSIKPNLDVKYSSGRAFDVPAVVLDSELAKAAFDWAPSTSLDEGLIRTWDWISSTR